MGPSVRTGQAMASSTTTRARPRKDAFQTSPHMEKKAGSLPCFPRKHNTHEVLCQQEPDWDCLIRDAVKCGKPHDALALYHQRTHQDTCFHPTSYTFVALLKACSKVRNLETGQQIHADIRQHEIMESNVYISSALVDMYAKCGSLAQAQAIFDKLTDRDVVLWTVLISGYAEHGYGQNALRSFEHMQSEGVSPDAFTFVGTLKACGSMTERTKGQEKHDEIVRKGFEKDLFVGSALVDMYARCGLLAEAQEVVEKLPVRDVVLWTALIAGYVEHGLGQGAIDCFKQMQLDRCSPEAVTFVCTCKACGTIRSTQKGMIIHFEATIKGFDGNPVVGSTLVDMYAKCGSLQEAQAVFDKLSVRNVVSWTALISGYTEHGHGEAALECYRRMQQEGISSDPITLLCSLKACGSIGATSRGRDLHIELSKKGWEREFFASSTLVDMYVKCGSLQDAELVFDKLPEQDVVSWTSLISGYAQLGQTKNVFNTLERMIEKGIKPDLVTLSSVLNACSQAGLVDKGHVYFEAFVCVYGLVPTLEHYTCMIDLLCRAGHIDKAIGMIKKIPFQPGVFVWHTVLGACRKWRNVELGRYAFEQAVHLNEKEASVYVCMSNIYADASMVEEANKIEALRVEMHAWK